MIQWIFRQQRNPHENWSFVMNELHAGRHLDRPDLQAEIVCLNICTGSSLAASSKVCQLLLHDCKISCDS